MTNTNIIEMKYSPKSPGNKIILRKLCCACENCVDLCLETCDYSPMPPTCLRNKSQSDLTIISESNKAIISVVAFHLRQHKQTKGISYAKLSKLVGCSDTLLSLIINGKLEFCSISLLTCIARACGSSLLEWLRSPMPEEVDTFGVRGAGTVK